MPTTTVKTIAKTSSPIVPDYTSLQAWEDACPSNLVTSDTIWQGQCLNQGEFTHSGNFAAPLLTVSGITTDATRYLHLTCAAGHSFMDRTGVRTSALGLYNVSNGVGINSTATNSNIYTFGSTHFRMSGIQIKSTSATHASGTANTIISQCLCEGYTPVFYGNWHNCLLIMTTNSTGGLAGNFAGVTAVYGCTFISTAVTQGNFCTASNSGNRFTVKNCAIFGWTGVTTNANEINSATTSYNATNLSSFPGSNNQVSLTASDQFENSASDWRPKTSGSLKNGTPDSTNTPTDITAFTRAAVSPWIGCWENSSSNRRRRLLTRVSA